MPKWKAIAIMAIIIISLVPVYAIYKYLEKRVKPRESMPRFLYWLLAVLLLIFVYTFLLVLVIKLIFPAA